jgi:hypothetical protein
LPALVSNSFNVTAAAPYQLVIEPLSSASATAGQTLPDFRVDVLDAYGNQTNSDAALTISTGGRISGTTTVTAVNGVATFSGIQLLTAGAQSLTATAPGLVTAVVGPISVNAGAAVSLAFQSIPASLTAGQGFAVQVIAHDAYGNVVTSGKPTITLSLAGTSTTSATATAAGGLASFGGLVLTHAGSYLVSATAPGLASATGALSVFAAAPAQLSWVVTPRHVIAGQAINTLQIAVADAFGNPVLSGASVTLAANHSGVLRGNTTAVVVNGVAAFTGLTLRTVGTYTLQPSVSGRPSVSGTALRVAVASAVARVRFIVPPARTQYVGHVQSTVALQITDRFGHPLAGQTVLLRTTIGHSYRLVRAITNSRGVALFRGARITQAGLYTQTASVLGSKLTASAHFTAAIGREI